MAEFNTNLQRSLREGAGKGATEPSPIMGTIKQIASDRFSAFGVGRQKTLTVVSNFIEDTALYSQLHGDTSFRQFLSSPAHARFRTHLNNAEVNAYFVTDQENFVARRQFWADWFFYNGANPRNLVTEVLDK